MTARSLQLSIFFVKLVCLKVHRFTTFRPVASSLITGGRFPQISDLFLGLKIGVVCG